MAMTGSQILLHMLAESGVRYIFGNPGTTELPLMDALVDERRIEYILGLQEVPVMAMADGYAMASRSPGVVNLHISCGLGNAMGMLYNAYREGTPLIVTAGQTDRRLRFEEPILWSDMERVARPWTKWAAEIQRIGDLPSAIRRAVQTAQTPPTGPVFLSLPIDLQSELDDNPDLAIARLPDARVRPPAGAIERAAQMLARAVNPAILTGSRVLEGDAVAELVAVAQRLGAPVYSESGTTHGRLAFPADHPLYGQGMPLWSPEVRERLAEFDVVLAVGLDLFRQYVYHEPARAMPEHIRLVQIDQDPWQLGKNYPADVGLIGHPKPALAELSEVLAQTMTPAETDRARRRGGERAAAHEAAREALRRRAASEIAHRPLTPLALMSTLAKVLPKEVAVVEEAVTTTNTYFERLAALRNTSGYFGHRGWALGWGLGCAVGVQLAWPERPVLAMLGEGAALYGIQGLWSAARYRIPVTFVVCNNAQYQILKIGAAGLDLPAAREGRFVGLDLVGPEVDMVAMARALGIEAVRITEPDELGDRVAASLAGDHPQLIDVPIERRAPSKLQYG